MKIEKTPVNNMETVRKLQLKYRKLKAAFKRKFAEYVAHGQADDFIATILDDLSDESDEEIPDELVRLSQIYDHSDNISQSALLSLVDHSKYTKEMLMNVFRCSKYKIEQARRLAASSSGFVLPKQQQLTRSRLDLIKAEHFLDYLFSRGLLQDVAYGTTRIKYEDGTQQKIAHSVLIAKFSHSVSFYIQN